MSLTREDVAAMARRAESDPSGLLKLSDEEALSAAASIVDVQDRHYATHPYDWLIEQVLTIDEADEQIKRFPDKPYLKELVMYHEEGGNKIAIPKSRRMLVTWTLAALGLHGARYKPHFAGFVQSATETKSMYVLENRMAFIEDHLAPIYRRPYTLLRGSGNNVLFFHHNDSWIRAVAQGGDAFRTYTPTWVFMDEIEFMTEGHQSFVAALPFAEKKCKLVLCSSSNGPSGVLASMARQVGFTRFN